MPKYLKSDDFVTAAAQTFDFLLEAGFMPVEVRSYRVSYTSGDFGIFVSYDDRDGRVETGFDAALGDLDARPTLTCLFVEAGLGPAQEVRETVRSQKMLSPVLESQAAAVRRVLPELTGEGAEALFRACHGR